MKTVGVLALQGDFAEHIHAIEACGARGKQIRWSHELSQIDALIIPGGESTAIAKLTGDNPDPIFDTIRDRIAGGMPVYGTCMGSIFLAKDIEGSTQGKLAAMDIAVRRNAFGPQKHSFETTLSIPALGAEPFHAVFIRAPIITKCGAGVQVLCQMEQGIVMARQGHLLVTAFHPEITGDTRVHEYFLRMIDEKPRAHVANPQVALAHR
jgi:5'-phosphate synthase pdxT subunit